VFGSAAVLGLFLLRQRSRKTPLVKEDADFAPDTVVIANAAVFEKIETMIRAGKNRLVFVADFDSTITTFWFDREKKRPGFSCHRTIEDCEMLPDEYRVQAKALAEHYYPLEVCHEISFKEKFKFMLEWVEKAHTLLLSYDFRKEYVKPAVLKADIKLRDGIHEIFHFLAANNVPVLVFSAGIANIVEEVLNLHGLLTPNVTVVSNRMIFGEDGKLLGFEEEMNGRDPFQVFNKRYEHFPDDRKSVLEAIFGERDQVILVGDSVGDAHMSDGMKATNEVRIGFLNHHIQNRLCEHKSKFDVVVLNDGTFKFLRKNILNKM